MAKTVDKAKDKDKSLVELVNDEFGAGTLVAMAGSPPTEYTVFSTGSLNLDNALGLGGLPRGRIVELYGPESSGKTTVALQTIASAMRAGHKCAFIDAEHALDIGYAQQLGVDLNLLLVSQPDCGEDALNVCEKVVKSGQCGVVVVDSVAALTPRAELEGNVGDFHVGVQARMMGQALRKLVAMVNTSNTLLIFINQTRAKIGGYGNPETTSGGNALKFFASIRMRIVRTGSNKAAAADGGDIISNTTKVKVVKNKCAPPFREAEFDIEFGRGVVLSGEVIDHAVAQKLVTKAGAWYSLANGERIAQGREGAKQYLENNPEVMAALLEGLKACAK